MHLYICKVNIASRLRWVFIDTTVNATADYAGRDHIEFLMTAYEKVVAEAVYLMQLLSSAESIHVRIDVFEQLGSEVILRGRLGGDSILAVVDAHTTARLHENFELVVDANRLHLFDKATQNAYDGDSQADDQRWELWGKIILLQLI